MRTQVHLKTAAIRSRRLAPFAAARILGGTVGLFFFAYPWLGGCSSEPIAPSRPQRSDARMVGLRRGGCSLGSRRLRHT